MKKFIRIPIDEWDNHNKEMRRFTRLFNPQHIVTLQPYPDGNGGTCGTITTVNGVSHMVPADAYHEAFVAIEDSMKP